MGKRIRALRKKLGLSQFQLGEKVGAETNTISRWETDKIEAGHDYVVKLANALNTTTDYLLGRVNEFNTPIPPTQDNIGHEQEDMGNAMLIYMLKNGDQIKLPPTQASYDFIAARLEELKQNTSVTFNQSYNAGQLTTSA